MTISMFTNSPAMAATNALNKSSHFLSIATERLATGKRINSAADDAAGLQIATRLNSQASGMGVALRNVTDGTALLQTAEGSFDELTNIATRMLNLATQAANGTNSDKDREAINSELNDLNSEIMNIVNNSAFAGDKLFGASGKFGSGPVSFQIGASAEEKMELDLSALLKGDATSIINGSGTLTDIASGSFMGASSGQFDLKDEATARDLITAVKKSMDSIGEVRSKLGASINRLGHTANNLNNMKDNTNVALGNIRDADMAEETSTMTRHQLLSQTSTMMLKQANSLPGIAISLLG
ncbi:flagellin [Chania multitudinisentens RB-25]|uniref:Flagellin n=1 Tax=Chania multitudinisentens RB-25 TaxID=1441930 RepID=W0LBN7_9GAMM|nr:flagellin [Chania multitudinisentens]AHG19682.1 flagellin [Chania multitudinisentens RB-25]